MLSPRAKALKINLDHDKYGTIVEIGAGQEVAGNFFAAGGASGSIAKTMSAYDMTFSDAIYGKEDSGRYVVKSRLHKMLDREYSLLEERLNGKRPQSTKYFVFADTVATRCRDQKHPGHGWLGVKFQITPGGPTNKLIIHVNTFEKENLNQQEALGAVGVNMIYACYYLSHDPISMVKSLMDGLNSKRIEIDMISLVGENFRQVDNRILSLQLVINKMTNAVMFDPQGKVQQPSEILYKKNIFALRGSFRPPTLVNLNMLDAGLRQFKAEPGIDRENILPLCEITLNNLKSQTNMDKVDFLARVDLLGALGQYTMVSNYQEHYRVSEYFYRYTTNLSVLAVGINALEDLFDDRYYHNLRGEVLEAMGRLFSRKVKLYVFPAITKDGNFTTSDSVELPNKFVHLYEYLKKNKFVEGYHYADREVMHIYSADVIRKVQNGEDGWEAMVPDGVADTIKKRCLFGYPCTIEERNNLL